MFCKLLLLCAVVNAVAGWWWRPTKCTTNSGCANNNCCLKNTCTQLTSRYAACSTVVYVREPDVYFDYCPCGQGLTCYANPVNPELGTCRGTCDSYNGCLPNECCVRGICFLQTEAMCQKTCKGSSDCGPNECCRTPSQLKGRKKRQTGEQTGGVYGVCEPIGQPGASCVYHGPVGPSGSDMRYECPCRSGLDCVNQAGGLTVPITVGTCTEKRQCARGADCRLSECCHFPKGRSAGGVCEPNGVKLDGICEAACISQNDCSQDECCLSAAQPRGRRKRESYIEATGSCTPFGLQGAECLGNNVAPGDGTMYRCPCQKGLNCANVVQTNPLLIGTCEPNNAVKICSTGADCPPDECCVSIIQIGRKKRQAPTGTCGPMRNAGDKCNPNQAVSGKPDGVVASCPCVSGLTCVDKPQDVIVLPNFETGVCEGQYRG